MDHRPGDLTPSLDELLAHDDHVDWYAERRQAVAQPNHLLEVTIAVPLDHEEVQVAVGTGVPAGPGAEEDHPRWRTRSFGQLAASLRNDLLTHHRLSTVPQGAETASRIKQAGNGMGGAGFEPA
jgi:hypothetical protein